jgi:hypothetical protein
MGGVADGLAVAFPDGFRDRREQPWQLFKERGYELSEQFRVVPDLVESGWGIEDLLCGRRGIRGYDAGIDPTRCRAGFDCALDDREKRFGVERLGNVIVHAGAQAAFAIAGERIGGQGNDGHADPARLLVLAYRAGRFEAIQHGHLHVHKNQVKDLPAGGVHGFLSVVSDDHRVTVFLKEADGEFLIGHVVFREQYP